MKNILLCCFMLVLLFMNTGIYAQDVDIQELIQETQKTEREGNSFKLVWWIPTEYWEATFNKAGNMTAAQKEEIINAVDQYIVIGVIDAKINTLGSIISLERNELIKKLSLDIGEKLTPLSDTEISTDMKNILGIMKPVISNMLGQFGQGFEFICFNGKKQDGTKIINVTSNINLTVNLSETLFKWRLPLGSLLPPKYDPDTNEKFPGNYKYSPYTGKLLIVKQEVNNN